MLPRERFLTAIAGREPDRVPFFEQGVASNVASAVLGRRAQTGGGCFRRDGLEASLRGPDAYEEYRASYLQDWGDLAEALEFDCVAPPWASGRQERIRRLGDNTYLLGNGGNAGGGDADEAASWSVVRCEPASDVLYELEDEVDRGGLAALERKVARLEREQAERQPLDPDDFPDLQALLARFRGRLAVLGGVGIAVPMHPVWLAALVERPDLVERYLDLVAARGCEAVDVQARLGCDLIWGGGDLAANQGPFYSPAHFRRFLLPRLRRIVDRCHTHALQYVFRSDGVLWPIAEDLFVRSGVDGYGEIDAQAGVTLGEVRRRLPHLLLWGNVDCGRTLTFGTPAEVAAETRRCLDQAAAGGRYILGSSNVVHSRVPVANLLAMVETCHRYGRY